MPGKTAPPVPKEKLVIKLRVSVLSVLPDDFVAQCYPEPPICYFRITYSQCDIKYMRIRRSISF